MKPKSTVLTQMLASLMAACVILGIAACKRDKCKNVACMNGVCVEGTCNCENGYTGEFCNEALNAAFAGTFSLEENCTAGSDQYEVLLQPDNQDLSKFSATGLWEQSFSVTGTIAQTGHSFVIERQQFGSYEIAGDGEISSDGNSVDLNYRIFMPGASAAFDICTTSLSK